MPLPDRCCMRTAEYAGRGVVRAGLGGRGAAWQEGYPAMFCCAATKGCRKFLRGAVSGHLRADERARAPGRKILD